MPARGRRKEKDTRNSKQLRMVPVRGVGSRIVEISAVPERREGLWGRTKGTNVDSGKCNEIRGRMRMENAQAISRKKGLREAFRIARREE